LLGSLMALAAAIFLLYFGGLGQGNEGQYFVVDVQGEKFTLLVTDPEAIRQAVENLEGKNRMFPVGRLVRGDGGFNAPWSWHLDPSSVRMAEYSIELCDGRPSQVESELDYWVDTVKYYCPWSARIVGLGRAG